jgi:hypothetical protein
MLSVIMVSHYAECRKAECRHAECHGARIALSITDP